MKSHKIRDLNISYRIKTLDRSNLDAFNRDSVPASDLDDKDYSPLPQIKQIKPLPDLKLPDQKF